MCARPDVTRDVTHGRGSYMNVAPIILNLKLYALLLSLVRVTTAACARHKKRTYLR